MTLKILNARSLVKKNWKHTRTKLYKNDDSNLSHDRQRLETAQISSDKRMGKQQSIHVVEYYSAIQRNKALEMQQHVKNTTWVKEAREKKVQGLHDSIYVKF